MSRYQPGDRVLVNLFPSTTLTVHYQSEKQICAVTILDFTKKSCYPEAEYTTWINGIPFWFGEKDIVSFSNPLSEAFYVE